MKTEVRCRKPAIILLILLTIYTIISATIGFPLGFGDPMARHIAKDYAAQIYPYCTFGKTGYNPVSSSYYTVVNYEGAEFSLATNPNKDWIVDEHRSNRLLDNPEFQDVQGKLYRQYFAAQEAGGAYFYLYYMADDPSQSVANLHLEVKKTIFFPEKKDDYMENIADLVMNYHSILSEYSFIKTIYLNLPFPALSSQETTKITLHLEEDSPLTVDKILSTTGELQP